MSVTMLLFGLLAPAFPGEDAGADLPVVVLIGDSIRLGYAPVVAEKLKGKATVLSVPENGGDSANVLKHLDAWAIEPRPAVIHFNAGLHDLKRDPANGTHQVEPDAYAANLKRILQRLEAETTARLIFATTTPVLDDRHNTVKPFHRREADVQAYNTIAREVLGASPTVAIDDLHEVIQKLGPATALGRDGVHFTPEAYRVLGERVAEAIETALKPAPAAERVACRWTDTPPTIDGQLDDPAWQNAELIDRFPRFWTGHPAATPTTARLVWDNDALYFAAALTDAEIRSYGTQRNDRLWLGDVFELFFKPDEARPEYYEFQANPRGVILELAFPRRGFDFATLAAAPPLGFSVAVAVNGTADQPGDRDRGWTVEGRIPWKVFAPSGGRPQPGAVWRFALCRYDYGPPGTQPFLMSSAPLRRASFHRYEDYGRLVFEK